MRKNVRYEIRGYKTPDETEEDALAGLVEEKKARFGKEGQIIVYCDTVRKTVQYAARLGGLCYHRSVGSAEEKKAIVRQLTEGRRQVFVATNALGLGVDAPTIRVVVHVGIVRRLRDYAQESGRAGRDGEASEAIILRPVRYDRRGRPIEQAAEKAEAAGVERAMWEFMGTRGCMRAVLDREMDGRIDRERCEDGEAECYRCAAAVEERKREARLREALDQAEHAEQAEQVEQAEREGGQLGQEDSGIEAASNTGGKGVELGTGVTAGTDVDVEIYQARARRRMQGWNERVRQSEEALEVERFKEMLEQWARGCPWCRATGAEEQVCGSHGLEECGIEDAGEVRAAVERISGRIRWAKFSGCFDCGLPQSICERFEARPDGGYTRQRGGRCQYPGVLIGSAVSMWGANGEQTGAFLRERMQQKGMDGEGGEGELVKWMGQKVRWAGIESNELCRAMVGLYEACRGSEE